MNSSTDVFPVEKDTVVLIAGLEVNGGFRGKPFQASVLVQGQSGAQRLQGEGTVHGAGFKVKQTKMPGQTPGNGALASAGWPVDRNDYLSPRFIGAKATFLDGHPRFFVLRPAPVLALCLAGAVKP